MKNKIAFFFLIISFVDISFIMAGSQNVDSIIQVLKPLDWEIMSCGKSKIGQKEKCTLSIINTSNKPIQG